MSSGLLVRRQALCLRLATLPGERTRARMITGRRIFAVDARIMASDTEDSPGICSGDWNAMLLGLWSEWPHRAPASQNAAQQTKPSLPATVYDAAES